ncbi:dehydrogenase [Brevundimonas intermedia]|uniref:Dehydrogenase n=1 Tax=Brevundimonas intermedia TaxID=74315 RepID=A0ABQ5TDF9_9CAUL|nr:NAD(P)/FAD-dependent oxidoreductase [Brevundimonas intermedia]GLK49333.1 dehydrogenase [Brevundimonas intermedia]
MSADFDVAVIGAGVVGLAVARAAAEAGRSVLVIERNKGIGQETSSRNSEVIHAGIYYPQGSLKARFCVRGSDLLYEYLSTRRLPHQRCGKVIIAVEPAEISTLDALYTKARGNGITNLRMLSGAEVRLMEPAVKAVAGLLSPSTGILDSHAFMLSLQGDVEANGGIFAFNAKFERGRTLPNGGFELFVGGEHPASVMVDQLVVAAGLNGEKVGQSLEGVAPGATRALRYAKGHYFRLRKRSPFKHLVYPVPVPGGLGTHATIDLGGQARFGPDVEWVDDIDYSFSPGRQLSFYQSISRWYPDIAVEDLTPDYTGIRPKLVGPAGPDADFCVETADDLGIKGLTLLQGIESPGLTSSLAIAEYVARRAGW